jgi:hypothetical protein
MKLTGLWIIARFEEGATAEAAGGPGRVHSVSRFDSRLSGQLKLAALCDNQPILCLAAPDTF